MQVLSRAPDASWQQQPPSLGWHNIPLEQSRAGPYRGASGTSWQEHQRHGGAAAGASGRCLHHMCPLMLYNMCTQPQFGLHDTPAVLPKDLAFCPIIQ